MADQSKYGGTAVGATSTEVEHLEGKALLELESEYGGVPITDPAVVAQAAADRVMSGEGVESLRIPDTNLMTEPPMEPGTSRASQEFPETFINSGVGSNLTPQESLSISTAALTTMDPAEIGRMLTATGKIGIQTAPDGATIATNLETGARSVINRPGMSMMDTMQALGIGSAFFPSGKIATMPTSLTGRLAAGTTAAGTTEYGLQQLQEAAGGESDPFDVGLSAMLGPVAELGRPIKGFTERIGRFIGSYMPEKYFGGLKGVLPEAKKQAIEFTEKAKGYLESGREAIIVTQDALQETMKPYKQIFYKMVERLPFTGTGGVRAAQREQRVEVLRHMSDRFGLNPNTNYGSRVIQTLNEQAGGAMDAATGTIKTTVDAISDEPVVIRDFTRKVTDIINAEERFGEMGNTGLIKLLEDTRNAVWQGGGDQNFGRSFGQVNDFLERLYANASGAPPAVRESIDQVADALRRDLARTADGLGHPGYARASQQLRTLYNNASKKTLDALIENGEVDQQVIRSVLRGGDSTQLRTLYNTMNGEGRESAQQMILLNAMRVGGWRRGVAAEAPIDPKKVLAWMEKENIDEQFKAFFPGEAAQAELGGLREYLRLTQAAQETGKGTGMAAAMGSAGMGGLDIGTLGILGALGHTIQSAPVRNLLLRLHHIKGDKRAQDAIMEKLQPLLMGVGRQVMQEWTDVDPHDQVYMQDMFPEANLSQQQDSMDQLRQAAGAID